jgi:hypothetical protein
MMVILCVAGRRWMGFGSICGVQSESLKRRSVFYQFLSSGRDDAILVFRKFQTVMILIGWTIVIRRNFLENGKPKSSDITSRDQYNFRSKKEKCSGIF